MAKLASFARNTMAKAMESGKPMLAKSWYYAKVELAPPSPTEIGEIKNGITRLISGFSRGTWRNLTVKQAWLNMLVATEVGCWFFIGECIGKGRIVGYNV